MREDVLIILNEREPLKQQLAGALSEQLESRNLTHQRLKPCANLAAIVLERLPRILVVDYLLGDEGTALDLLAHLREQKGSESCKTIVWTDERSVSVAVNAMKLGAFDYLELGNTKDIEKVLGAIQQCLDELDDGPKPTQQRRASSATFERPIGQSQRAKSALAEVESTARQNAPVTVLLGESGSGRSTMARYFHLCRRAAGTWIEIELENWAGEATEIFGGALPRGTVPLLSYASTVFLEHADFDTDGELLEACMEQSAKIWNGSNSPALVVGTQSPEVAAAWERLTRARVIHLPPLAERREDILPLLQRFSLEAKQLGAVNKLELTPTLVSEVERLPWPGNVRQLRGCLFDVLTTPLAFLRDLAGTPDENDQAVLLKALIETKARFESSALPAMTAPPPVLVRRALDAAGGNFRLAAAQLGIGVPQVRSALKAPASSNGARQ